jgi:hypothetical protein
MEYIKNLYVFIFAFSTFSPNLPKEIHAPKIAATSTVSVKKVNIVYNSLNANNLKLPNLESFTKAFEGYYLLKEAGKIKNNILTIVDFSLSSAQKRMWVIDMNENKVLFNSLVAHGQNSGNEYAEKFSNENESHKSSLGFFTTAEVYNGKHGLSLKLDGLEKGINDKARQRAIVIHGADYVSNSFIKNHNRLGRSQGCPALPVDLSKKIIEKIKDKSCLFIYYPSENYTSKSKLIS